MGLKGGETRVQIPRYLFSFRDSFTGLLNCMVCCVCVVSVCLHMGVITYVCVSMCRAGVSRGYCS